MQDTKSRQLVSLHTLAILFFVFTVPKERAGKELELERKLRLRTRVGVGAKPSSRFVDELQSEDIATARPVCTTAYVDPAPTPFQTGNASISRTVLKIYKYISISIQVTPVFSFGPRNILPILEYFTRAARTAKKFFKTSPLFFRNPGLPPDGTTSHSPTWSAESAGIPREVPSQLQPQGIRSPCSGVCSKLVARVISSHHQYSVPTIESLPSPPS